MPRLFCPLLSAMLLVAAGPAAGGEPMLRVTVGTQTWDGTPLAFSEKLVFLLARDGRLAEFAPAKVTKFDKLPGEFRSYTQAEIRGQLLREFGQGYEVSGVGHYLVVHPAGRRDTWAPRFEALYRSFVQYFSARGWQLTEPRFPLIAVVYPRQVDFQRQAAEEGLTSSEHVLGYYSPLTNRILMYDAAVNGVDWSVNAETIIHEAAHQSAFNTGVHGRFGDAPRWVIEGLGTMFEARGVWQSRAHPRQSDRINRGRLEAHRRYAARRPKDALAQLISSDRPFSHDAEGAYAEAWALSFYLCEREPRRYMEYLAKTAALPPFDTYKSPQRLQDFTDVFGSDLVMLDARLQRFLAGL